MGRGVWAAHRRAQRAVARRSSIVGLVGLVGGVGVIVERSRSPGEAREIREIVRVLRRSAAFAGTGAVGS
jgi:hypothetical protein